MAKIKRSMMQIEESQQKIEKTNQEKFSDTQHIARKLGFSRNRIPQICCTMEDEDMEQLNKLILYAVNKKGKLLTISHVVKTLINYGFSKKEDLEF